jgi:hypothetical protein
MKKSMMVLSLAIISTFLCSFVWGEEFPSTPAYTCTSGEVMAVGGFIGATYELEGNVSDSNSSSHPVHCNGSYRIIGDISMSSGTCTATGTDGEQIVITYEKRGTETSFNVASGTGRNDTIDGGGNVEKDAMLLAVSQILR